MALKIGVLAEGKDTSITSKFSAEQMQSLTLYAKAYEQEHGKAVDIKALVPLMVQSFLDGDRGFKKFLKAQGGKTS